MIALGSDEVDGDQAVLQMLSWLSERHGFGTFVKRVPGKLDASTYATARQVQDDLLKLVEVRYPAVFASAIVSPSERSALAQALQLPGVSGVENNTLLLDGTDFTESEPMQELVEHSLFAAATHKNLLVLRARDAGFADRRELHVWLTWNDRKNSNLLLLLGYILLGTKDWRHAEMSVFAAVPTERVNSVRSELVERLSEGRLPIADDNVTFFGADDGETFDQLVKQHSSRADLVLFGLTLERLQRRGAALFEKHPEINNALFLLATEEVGIE